MKAFSTDCWCSTTAAIEEESDAVPCRSSRQGGIR